MFMTVLCAIPMRRTCPNKAHLSEEDEGHVEQTAA